jgi:hypothetical protein
MFNRSATNPTGNTGNTGGAANGTMNRRAFRVSIDFLNQCLIIPIYNLQFLLQITNMHLSLDNNFIPVQKTRRLSKDQRMHRLIILRGCIY